MRKEKSLWLVLIGVLGGLSACDKGEIPVAPREPGDVITKQIEMGSDYRNVLYYNLKTNDVVHQHLKTDWDLGFETGEAGWHVILNSSKAMAAASTNSKWLNEITTTEGVEWKHDVPSGNLDSTAIGDWKSNSSVFLIDRGYNLNGNPIGTMKLRFEETDEGYLIHFGNVASTDSSSLEISKNESLNFVCVSLNEEGTIVEIEPNKEDWHLKFTQYTHLFDEEEGITPYSVTGILLNPYQMKGAQQAEVPFDSVDYDFASSFMYHDAVNVIGYDWKSYDFDLGSYTVFPEMVYVLRSSEGIYWKLHFIDFYTQNGEKGAPMFEFREL